MRIAQLVPGSGGGFYCENCLRDLSLVKAMEKKGHEVVMVPMYLPPQGNSERTARQSPIFFGGINVYLQQRFALFRRTPRWIDGFLDGRKLLGWAGRMAHMTRACALGETTISMLRGEDGRQVKELERLVRWLGRDEHKPDVVCLSNILLAGLAGRIKAELSVPVVCLLQDEDAFVDALAEPYAQQAWDIIAERARDIDAFIAVSRYYADVMGEKLDVNSARMHAVYMGVSLDGHECARAEASRPTIGYLSRMCADKGLDTLAEAFVVIKRNERLSDARLRIAGGKTGNDEDFVGEICRRLGSVGLSDDVEFLSDFDQVARFEFLRTLSVLSVPEKRPVACGLYVLEAMAAGVPVVQPASGVFGELLEITGGGILCEPNNPEALAEAIERLLLDPDYARALGDRGRESVFEKFNIGRTADEIVGIYEQLVGEFERNGYA